MALSVLLTRPLLIFQHVEIQQKSTEFAAIANFYDLSFFY